MVISADYRLIELTMSTKKNRTMPSLSSSLFSLLPEEIIIDEILLNLPMDSLLQLRRVSRYFRSLITSRSFTKKHQDHNSTTTTQPLLLITYFHEEVYQHYSCNLSSPVPKIVTLPCPFISMGIYGSCNGLLFLHGTEEENNNRGCIWNPCTREFKKFTTPSMDEDLFGGIQVSSWMNLSASGFCGFSYDRTNDEYKILYHENRVGHLPVSDDIVDGIKGNYGRLVSVTEFKLYTLESDTWKDVTVNPYRSLFFSSNKRSGILVNGALHWIMSVTSSSFTSAWNAKIISFDMEKEEFRELQKPPYCSTRSPKEDHRYRELLELQECLCLCQFPRPKNSSIAKNVEIWMLKDYTVKDSWTKLFTISLKENLSAIRHLKLSRFVQDGDFRMFRDIHSSDLGVPRSHDYCCQSRLVDKISKLTQNRWSHVVIYKKSLVSLNSGAYTNNADLGLHSELYMSLLKSAP